MNEYEGIFDLEQHALIELAHAKAKRERFAKLCEAVRLLAYDEQVKLFQVIVEELSGA